MRALVTGSRGFGGSNLVTNLLEQQGMEALYATYPSVLSPEQFDYGLTRHIDPRGKLAEVVVTADGGQLSYFTAQPGVTRGEDARIVETVPGWAHDSTNIGRDEMVVMLWANEAFDPAHPDTVAARLAP